MNSDTLLIIDDDPINLRMLAHFFTSKNISYVYSTDGHTAWEILRNNPEKFKLVIVDRMMLGLDGMGLLKKMQQDPVLKNIPVIFMTGEAEREEHLEALKAGAFDFIYKPIDFELLLILIKKAFRQ